MSHGNKEPTNPNAADYKIYARLDAGETLDDILANPPTTIHNKITSESNIRQEHGFWRRWRSISPKSVGCRDIELTEVGENDRSK